jgi:hypothetical protein
VAGRREIAEEFQDRFLIGTDVKLGDEDRDYQTAESHRKILRQLFSKASSKIAWQNAVQLLHLKTFPEAMAR